MPWKTSDEMDARRQFVMGRLARGTNSMVELCRRHKISRECGHKWWRRFCVEGWAGLRPRKRVAHSAQRLQKKWWPRLQAVRRRCADFGPKKLHWQLRQDFPRER